MKEKNHRCLNIKKIQQEKPVITISSQDALKDVTPLALDESVIRGEKKITVSIINKDFGCGKMCAWGYHFGR